MILNLKASSNEVKPEQISIIISKDKEDQEKKT